MGKIDSESSLKSADIQSGKFFECWEVPIKSTHDFQSLNQADKLTYLIRFGILAPTTHNTVPERFRISPDESKIDLFVDRKYILPSSDSVGRQATISMGCVIENIVIAASCYGLSRQIKLFINNLNILRPISQGEDITKDRYAHLASLSFQTGLAPLKKEWLQAMLNRKMVRAEFDESIPVGNNIKQQLKLETSKYPKLNLYLLTDRMSLNLFGKFQEQAENFVFNDPGFARELGNYLLPNNSQSEIGMRGREFGLADEYALRLHQGLRGLEPILPDDIAGFAANSKRLMGACSGIGIITVWEDSTQNRIDAGRAYERICLLLNQNDFSTSMHAGITEVSGPNMALKARLKTLSRPTVVFRIGRPKDKKDVLRPHAARPSVEDLLI